jgi:EAL domain-containing protein (putative c-di-GMP-specific phosphodiesterase class I)
MRQLRDADFLAVVDETLERTGIDPARIEFEVTESTMIEDAGIVQTLLTELRQRGTRIAVDDFGTGYSSLSYLQKLPLDRVKVDQSFVAGVDKRKGRPGHRLDDHQHEPLAGFPGRRRGRRDAQAARCAQGSRLR